MRWWDTSILICFLEKGNMGMKHMKMNKTDEDNDDISDTLHAGVCNHLVSCHQVSIVFMIVFMWIYSYLALDI